MQIVNVRILRPTFPTRHKAINGYRPTILGCRLDEYVASSLSSVMYAQSLEDDDCSNQLNRNKPLMPTSVMLEANRVALIHLAVAKAMNPCISVPLNLLLISRRY